MAGSAIDKYNFDLIPSDTTSVSETYTLPANGWSGNSQRISIPQNEPFILSTVLIPPDELSVWAECGVYASEENISGGHITFTCSDMPSIDLHLSLSRTRLSSLAGFIGEGSRVDGYIGLGGDIVVPDGVTEIGAEAFKDNGSITSVLVPYTEMTAIGAGAFEGCSSLTSFKGDTGSMVGPEPDEVYVDTIGANAFKNCINLTSIVLNVVDTVADYAFSGCTGLTEITFCNGGTYGDSTKLAFDGCVNVTNIIPGGAPLLSDVDYSFTDILTAESLAGIINHLGDGTQFGLELTLTIGATNRSRLTAEQIAAATAKGWTIV